MERERGIVREVSLGRRVPGGDCSVGAQVLDRGRVRAALQTSLKQMCPKWCCASRGESSCSAVPVALSLGVGPSRLVSSPGGMVRCCSFRVQTSGRGGAGGCLPTCPPCQLVSSLGPQIWPQAKATTIAGWQGALLIGTAARADGWDVEKLRRTASLLTCSPPHSTFRRSSTEHISGPPAS
jgi:hypothetical protein